MKVFAVKPQDRELLWNINQKYLYEMTNFYDDEMDTLGNLNYGYFDAYFTDPKRKAFFLFDEKQVLVGFAMIHPYSNLNEKPDYVLAEFTVFPVYRRKHLAEKAAEMIFERFKGCWEIKYNEKNIAAKTLWNKATEQYFPKVTRLNDTETVLSFSTLRPCFHSAQHDRFPFVAWNVPFSLCFFLVFRLCLSARKILACRSGHRLAPRGQQFYTMG